MFNSCGCVYKVINHSYPSCIFKVYENVIPMDKETLEVCGGFKIWALWRGVISVDNLILCVSLG